MFGLNRSMVAQVKKHIDPEGQLSMAEASTALSKLAQLQEDFGKILTTLVERGDTSVRSPEVRSFCATHRGVPGFKKIAVVMLHDAEHQIRARTGKSD